MDPQILASVIATLNDQLPQCTEVEALRLSVIIQKLNRLRSDEVSAEDRYIKNQENLKKTVQRWKKCEQLRAEAKVVTPEYFYYYMFWEPVPKFDLKTFQDFVQSDDCLCGNCKN